MVLDAALRQPGQGAGAPTAALDRPLREEGHLVDRIEVEQRPVKGKATF